MATTSASPTAIELIAGTPQGGGQDRAARALAAALSGSAAEGPAAFEVVVTNVPGRGGGAAWERVAASPPDSGAVAVSSPTLVTNAIRDPNEPGVSDLTHLALLCTESIAFAAATSRPPGSAVELLEMVADGKHLRFAIATALGNTNHLAVSLVHRAVDRPANEMAVVAFGSARTAVAEVLAGNADVAAVSLASVLPEVDAGTARLLALTAPVEAPTPLDGTPTWADLGVQCDVGTWRGLVAPPRQRDRTIAWWDERLAAAVRHEAWRTALRVHAWSDTHLPSAAATAFVAEQERRLRSAARSLVRADG